jgi:hypothetical protein
LLSSLPSSRIADRRHIFEWWQMQNTQDHIRNASTIHRNVDLLEGKETTMRSSTGFRLSSATVVGILLSLCLSVVQSRNDDGWNMDMPSNHELLEMMTEYQMQDHRRSLLLGGSTANQPLGKRCGNRNTCDENLQCTPVALGRRCLPQNCLQNGLKKFQEEFNMIEYQHTIFQMAGVNEEQLRQEIRDGGNRRNFLATNAFQSIQNAMDQNPGPSKAIFAMYDECVAEHVNGTALRVDYQGIHLEGGVAIDGVLDYFWEVKTGAAFVRYCIGLNWFGGAEVSLLYLIAQNTNDPEAITETCTMRTDINFGVGVNLGVGYGVGMTNGIGQLEFTGGLGVSITAGAGYCTVSKA